MGQDTYKVSFEKVFQANRKKLCCKLQETGSDGVIFLMGGTNPERFDSDHEPLFRQESYFWYLTGVKEPDCALALDVATQKCTLFIPKLPADYATIMGPIKTCEEIQQLYQVDAVKYMEEIETTLEELLLLTITSVATKRRKKAGDEDDEKKDDSSPSSDSTSNKKLLLMKGLNTDSGNMYLPPTEFLEKAKHGEVLQSHADTDVLFPILCECRVIKTDAELDVLRHVTELSSHAHAYVMRNLKAGMMEYQGESLFRHYCYYSYGCRFVGYTPICGCGPNAAILHYGHSGEPNAFELKDGDICLFDLGAEYCGYGSDITCSFPANGTFTEKQKDIYNGVLQAQLVVYKMLKPGVSWVDCHKAAEKAILKQLAKIGIVIPGDKSFDELVEMRLGAVFLPCGLGHFLGTFYEKRKRCLVSGPSWYNHGDRRKGSSYCFFSTSNSFITHTLFHIQALTRTMWVAICQDIPNASICRDYVNCEPRGLCKKTC